MIFNDGIWECEPPPAVGIATLSFVFRRFPWLPPVVAIQTDPLIDIVGHYIDALNEV
jgi:hypothetical protein